MSRFDKLPPILQSPRINADSSTSRSIDIALKSLRKSSRQIHQIAGTLNNDLHMLERIYYKSKNVQRPTTAWKKVIELRRIGDRMKEAALENLVDALRRSFYDSSALKDVEGYVPWLLAPSVLTSNGI